MPHQPRLGCAGSSLDDTEITGVGGGGRVGEGAGGSPSIGDRRALAHGGAAALRLLLRFERFGGVGFRLGPDRLGRVVPDRRREFGFGGRTASSPARPVGAA